MGALELFAPVRAASDGDNGSPGGSTGSGGSGGPAQTTTTSVGAVQVGSADADAPVRVASDGDNGSPGGSTGSGGSAGSQTATDSIATVQVGSGQADAPGDGSVGTLPELPEVASVPTGVPGDQDSSALPGDLTDTGGDLRGTTTVPALELVADDEANESLATVAQPADSQTASASAGTLPFTGAGLAMVVTGLAFAASGFALRLTARHRAPVL